MFLIFITATDSSLAETNYLFAYATWFGGLNLMRILLKIYLLTKLEASLKSNCFHAISGCHTLSDLKNRS